MPDTPDGAPHAATGQPSPNGVASPFPAPEPVDDAELGAQAAEEILEQLKPPERAAPQAPEPDIPPPSDITLVLHELASIELRLTTVQFQLALVAGLVLLAVAGATVYKTKVKP